MLIYEIARQIHSSLNTEHTLSCKFPSGTGFITVKSIYEDQVTVLKFKLDPQTSIEVSVLLNKT